MVNVNEILDKHALHAIIHKKSSSHPKESDESNDIFQLVVGFSPSDGVVIISKNKSAIFVDGRYSLAARQTINQNQFEILDLKRSEIIKWIAKNIPPIHKIAYDPVFYMHSEIEFLKNGLGEYDFAPIDIKEFFDVPAKKRNLNIHYIKNRKAPDEGRLSLICETISKNELNAYLVCEACTIAWLFNVRDFGSKYTPIPELYLLITSNHDKILYVSKAYEINRSGDIKTEEQLHSDLARLHRVGIDKSETPSSICHKDFIHLDNPCLLAKSIKNTEEINDIKKASQKDSIAIINFLHWIYNNDLPEISELDVVKKILYFRTLDSDFIGESFQTIAAADDHAAVVHYSPSEKNSKKIENILLIDSGGQYRYGTTDITRTISLQEPTEEQKFLYTLVLKGHIALSNARFPTDTTGAQLDPLARQFLWRYSCDYNHSTGHGIGYCLNVHEGPGAISKNNNIPLQAGMIFSNEPGYYKENQFGIRLENMMLVKKETNGFLSFETISLVPFDSKFINDDLLDTSEISWLKTYNHQIISSLDLKNDISAWLASYLNPFL